MVIKNKNKLWTYFDAMENGEFECLREAFKFNNKLECNGILFGCWSKY